MQGISIYLYSDTTDKMSFLVCGIPTPRSTFSKNIKPQISLKLLLQCDCSIRNFFNFLLVNLYFDVYNVRKFRLKRLLVLQLIFTKMYTGGAGNIDYEDRNRQLVLEGRAVIERTGESLARSTQIAIETENIGTEVISELGEQRETLLRAKSRLTSADEQLESAKSILRRMRRNVLYNKLILILIIILEAAILGTVSYLKFFKKH